MRSKQAGNFFLVYSANFVIRNMCIYRLFYMPPILIPTSAKRITTQILVIAK